MTEVSDALATRGLKLTDDGSSL